MLILALALTQSGSNPVNTLSKSLDGLGAKLDHELTRNSEQFFGRPGEVFNLRQSAAEVQSALSKGLTKTWTFVVEDVYDQWSFYSGDREITIWKNVKGSRLLYTRTPEWVRAVRERRYQFASDLEGTLPDDFAFLAGEGWYNQILYPAGSSRTMYYRGGQMNGTETLTAFGRKKGGAVKLWKIKLAKFSGKVEPGTLNQWLKGRGLKAVDAPREAQKALGEVRALAFHNQNHGDGGRDVGFIEENGKGEFSQHPMTRHQVLTLAEERYIKKKGIKPD